MDSSEQPASERTEETNTSVIISRMTDREREELQDLIIPPGWSALIEWKEGRYDVIEEVNLSLHAGNPEAFLGTRGFMLLAHPDDFKIIAVGDSRKALVTLADKHNQYTKSTEVEISRGKALANVQNVLTSIQTVLHSPQFDINIDEAVQQMKDILVIKGADYSGDQLAPHTWMNFIRAAELASGTPEGAMVYLLGIKFARLSSLYATPRHAMNESAIKSLVDIGNYVVLLTAYIMFRDNLQDLDQVLEDNG